MPFDRGDRTYHLSDERLRAFRDLPVEKRIAWVEDLANFVRLAREGRAELESRAHPATGGTVETRDQR